MIIWAFPIPAHGGEDPGTSGNGIVEKDLTLKISQYMHDRLNDLGIENSMTRTNDETLSPSVRPGRTQGFYGKDNDVIVVSNHINAGGGDGAEVIYALRNSDRLSRLISDNISATGQNVRKYYQRRLPSNPNLDYYYMLRETPNNESVIVEYGFADTPADATFLKNNWENLAEAVVKSLATYIGVPYTPKVTGNVYVVKAGDTLWNIARNNGLTVNELKELNNLKSNALSIGQVLKISKDTGTNENNDEYIVKSGDSLYAIARKYNTTVDELKRINNLTSNNLSIGQVLKLKSNTIETPVTQNTYIVKSGDSLYKIANMYGISVDDLKKANNLSSNLLSIGQRLIIPSNANSEKVYTVKAGDTIFMGNNEYII